MVQLFDLECNNVARVNIPAVSKWQPSYFKNQNKQVTSIFC